jgi:23S rRNA (guanosine2251-2'-O)-methyltransferase
MHDFYIYGRNAVIEQLLHHPNTLKRIFLREDIRDGETVRTLAAKHRIPVIATNEKEIKKLLKDDVVHQGVLALSRPFEYANFDQWLGGLDMDSQPTALILDHIQDVSNLGAIIRTATAAGVAGIIVAELNQAPITSAVYKTSAGTVGRVPIIQVGNVNQAIEKLKKARFWIYGLAMADGGGATDLWQTTFDSATALVIGGEGEGVREKTKEHCDMIVSIPMEHSVESLNASVSAALVCYEIMRQRK